MADIELVIKIPNEVNTEAVKEFVESDAFKKLMESLDEQDRAATEDAEQFLRDIKAKEQEE